LTKPSDPKESATVPISEADMATLSVPEAGDAEAPLPTVNGYTAVRRVGQGGMGVVFEAEQHEPVKRRVAIKVIQAGPGASEFIVRFEAERQALARMEHAGIARIFDAGYTAEGLPFYSMEFVDGEALTTYCDQRRSTTRGRLQLFIDLCRAVQHAHTKSIIHRDLKPSNILVAETDGRALPKVIDFGLAKSLGEKLTEEEAVTKFGHAIGTPAYMSPEQIRGVELDTRSDIYALGAILYELLVGHRPYDRETVRRPDFLFRHQSGDLEPRTPSDRLSELGDGDVRSKVAELRGTDPSTLTRELRGDLDWIVMKAMAHEPDHRYETVHDLVLDIERHLNHEPVLARPPTAAYRMSRFVRRHRLGVSVAAVLFLGLSGGVLGTTVGLLRARAAEARATAEDDRSERVSKFLANMLASVDAEQMGRSLMEDLERRVASAAEDPDAKQTKAAAFRELTEPVNATNAGLRLLDEEVLARAAATIKDELGDDPVVAARLEHEIANTYRRLGLVKQAREHFETAWAARRSLLGQDHIDTLRSQAAIGRMMWDAQRNQEVIDFNREVLERVRAVVGDDHELPLGIKYVIAIGLTDLGQHKEAEVFARQSAETARRVLGPDHARTLEAVDAHASALMWLKRYPDSEKLYRDSVERSTRLKGSESPGTLDLRMKHDTLLYYLGRYDESEKDLLEVLAAIRRIHGDVHPQTFKVLYVLGCMSAHAGKKDEALDWVSKAIDAGFRYGPWLAQDPDFASVRDDPRFQELVKRATPGK
jgi:non-specific serine/threonine protein kinase/serine/threonine-protein kinase